ncbi:two-component system response regulator [Desulfuromonas versatilis]|uniref:Two-component system response regulator n=1 Tax=Desulfuromonas versatilis TaxID=2802975 RepID=A0ABN6DXC6_9BACT|nr:PilZ domain-containing protein [Desulfuromonas versatilis]BCR04788.1 two-component system response regulator [Desulfuromonas versatilis]
MANPKILLADESRFFTELELRFLKQTPAEITVARACSEVLDLSRKMMPALIYLAYSLADQDGATCCRTLKGDPDLARIPVVLIGDGTREAEMTKCKAAGADGLLTKPIERRSFLALGRQFLATVERREPRLPCRTPAFFSLLGKNGYGNTVDLSAGGVFIEYSGVVTPEARIQLNFTLPGRPSQIVGVSGRVAWINNGPELQRADMPPGFGVEFLDLSVDSAHQIEVFLKNLMGHASQGLG